MSETDLLSYQENPEEVGVGESGWAYLSQTFGRNREAIGIAPWNQAQMSILIELGVNNGECSLDTFYKIYNHCCPVIKAQCAILKARINEDNRNLSLEDNQKIGSPLLLGAEIASMFHEMFPQCIYQFCVECILEDFYSNYNFFDEEKAGIRDASLLDESSKQYSEFLQTGLPGRDINKKNLIDSIKRKQTEYLRAHQVQILYLAQQQVLKNFGVTKTERTSGVGSGTVALLG